MKRFDLGILIAAVAVVAGGIGFAAGHYTAGKTAGASASPGSAGNFGGQGGGGFGGRSGGGFRRGFGVRGTVTTVSGSTITVNDANGTTRTITVSSSTSFISGSDRSAASESDIKTGDTLLASGQTGSDGSVTATRVIINPPVPSSNQVN